MNALLERNVTIRIEGARWQKLQELEKSFHNLVQLESEAGRLRAALETIAAYVLSHHDRLKNCDCAACHAYELATAALENLGPKRV